MINEADKNYLIDKLGYFFYDDFSDFSERVSIMIVDGGVNEDDARDFAFKSLMKQKELNELKFELEV